LEDHVTIGAHVSVGHDVLFLTKTHARAGGRPAGASCCAPVVVGDGAWIGARATLLPGVTIGAGSVVAASTVVEQDVPDNTLLTGGQRISLARWR
jgi:maltose O-acetyltransferase